MLTECLCEIRCCKLGGSHVRLCRCSISKVSRLGVALGRGVFQCCTADGEAGLGKAWRETLFPRPQDTQRRPTKQGTIKMTTVHSLYRLSDGCSSPWRPILPLECAWSWLGVGVDSVDLSRFLGGAVEKVLPLQRAARPSMLGPGRSGVKESAVGVCGMRSATKAPGR